MIPAMRKPLSTIEPITPQKLAQGGALFGQVPVWTGFQYAPANPVDWLSNSVSQGRISEINVIGNASSSVVGNRVTLNILGGLNVNAQPVSGINTGTNLTATVVGGIATLNANAGITVNGQAASQIATGANISASVVGGVATLSAAGGMSSFRAEQVSPLGSLLYSNNIQQNFALQFQAGNNISLTPTTNVDGTRIRIDANAINYTHPAYTPLTLTPSIVGNTLFTHTLVSDGIGSLANGIPIALPLPTPASTNLAHSGTGTTLFSGVAPNYTMKGIRSLTPSTLSVTDTGVSLDLSVNIPVSGVQSLQNGTNTTAVNLGAGAWRIDANIPANVSAFNGATGNINLVNGLNSTVVSLGGGTFRLDVSASGGGAVNQVTSGNATVLSVSPSAGNVVITPQGTTGAFIPSISGNVLTLWSQNLNAGSTQNMTATQITLPSGTNSFEVRRNGMVVNSLTSILDFTGAGVNVTNNGVVEINIPGATGGGINGISVNGAGTYSNLQFTGSGVSVLGNLITIASGGGILQGYSGNGLTVTADSVSLALASGANPGAMPMLPMNANLYLNGLGQWTAPTGGVGGVQSIINGTNTTAVNLGSGVWRIDATVGAGGVSSITSGNPSVLTVTPTTGSVVITPSGFNGVFLPTWSEPTRTIGIPTITTNNGIVTDISATFLTISGGASLPSGALDNTFRHNGTTWVANSTLQIRDSGADKVRLFDSHLTINNTGGFGLGVGISNHGTTGLLAESQLGVDAPEIQIRSNRVFLGRRFGTALDSSLLSEPIVVCLGDQLSKLSFFGGPAQFRQPLPAAATDPASTQTLVNAIRQGLITLNLFT